MVKTLRLTKTSLMRFGSNWKQNSNSYVKNNTRF